MSNKTNVAADWRVSENRSFSYIGRLGTSKGIGYVQGNDDGRIEIIVSLKIFVNGADTGKWAKIETKELNDYEAAHAWVESLLL
jgi:hypothetical protein